MVCRCFSTKQNATKIFFFHFGLFWPYFNQKTAKIDQNEENWQNPNRLMKFSEIWYVDASQQTNKMLQKNLFWISAFFGHFLTKEQPKLTKNEENLQNPNRLMKFSEIWYVDASQQNKMLHNFFLDFGLIWPFL